MPFFRFFLGLSVAGAQRRANAWVAKREGIDAQREREDEDMEREGMALDAMIDDAIARRREEIQRLQDEIAVLETT